MSRWRDLCRQLPQFTYLADVEAYADVFDAIDEALGRGRGCIPGPDEQKRLGQISVTDRAGNKRVEDFVVSVMPVTPVRIANTVRLCVGLLQSEVWRGAERWHLGVSPPCGQDVLLPDLLAMLARKLRPTPGEVADVAMFLLMPSPGLGEGEESYGEPFSPVLRFLERYVTPPACEPARAALLETRRRLGVVKARAA